MFPYFCLVICVAMFFFISKVLWSTLYMDLFSCKFLCKGSTLGAFDFLQLALWKIYPKIYVKPFGGHFCDYIDTRETL